MVLCITNLYYECPRRCNNMQSIFISCKITLYVSGAIHTHHQEYIKTVVTSHWYRSYILVSLGSIISKIC